MRTFSRLVLAVVIAEGAGIIGSLFTSSALPDWYATLVKPAFTPPSWVFAPVWIFLFLFMGIALWLAWQKRAFVVFGIQLALNVLWSALFFGLHSPGWAFVDIVALWLAIVATIVVFAKYSRLAAWLLVPYLLWVSFAAYLNYAIWTLN